jgi:acyl-CoA synthetase (AMP-forming)/AMP-acid ligase II
MKEEKMEFEFSNISKILERNADKWPDDVALVEINPQELEARHTTWREYSLIESSPVEAFRSEITWREFEDKANRFANLLLSLGYRKGDKIAILLMNCLEWLPVYFGVLKAGCMAVPLNFRYTAEEIKYCLELSDAKALVFGPEFTGRVEQIIDRIPQVRNSFYVGDDCPSFSVSFRNLTDGASAARPNIELGPNDEAAIYFSSGTTGFPKAIVLQHRCLLHSCIVEQKHHGQTKDDNFLCIPPLYHTGAKMHWFGSFLVGGKAVLLKGVKPEWIIRAASEEKCTIVWLLVPWAQDILDAIDRGDVKLSEYDLSAWRLMHIGAQPVPPALIKRWKSIFPNHDYDTNYGLSESTGPGAVHLGVENTDHVGAIGVAGYGWETKIVGKDGITPVKSGEVGELALKGPGVMKEYYRNPQATAEIMKEPGWLLTGDMAEERDGFIYLVDRAKDVIITGGENLYPVQIEDFIRTNPKVKDVAVIGLPDARLGEIAAAIVSVKEGMTFTESEFDDFCRELPRYKRPRKVIFAEVPRNPTGKIEKPRLRKMYGADALVAKQAGISSGE